MIDWGDEFLPEPVVPDLKKRRVDHERPVHVAVKRYLEAVCPRGTIVAWIRNEVVMPKYIEDDPMKRARYYEKLKVAGHRKGMPDLMACLPEGRVIFMEVKPPKGGTVSPVQREIHSQLTALSHNVAVVRSIDDAAAALRQWGRGSVKPWEYWIDFWARELWLDRLQRETCIKALLMQARGRKLSDAPWYDPDKPSRQYIEMALDRRVGLYRQEYQRTRHEIARTFDMNLEAGATGAQMRVSMRRIAMVRGFGDCVFDDVFVERVQAHKRRQRYGGA